MSVAGKGLATLRDADGNGSYEMCDISADNLHAPCGLAFADGCIYVVNQDALVCQTSWLACGALGLAFRSPAMGTQFADGAFVGEQEAGTARHPSATSILPPTFLPKMAK